MRYELTEDLKTGNAIVDNEHSQLLKAVNDLMDACNKGQGRAAIEPALKFLIQYVDQHFAHEEQLQQRANYPDLAKHRQIHEDYKRKLKEIAAQIPASGPTVADLSKVNSHVAVLISHIRVDDKKLGAFLKDK